MGLRIVLVVVAILSVSGCAGVAVPPEPTPSDTAELTQARLDALWQQTGLDDKLRPDVRPDLHVEAPDYGYGFAFAACMEERGWSAYFTEEGSAGWRSMSEATSDGERLDWYRCFAAQPTSEAGGLGSVERYDFLYNYYQQVLIPCLEDNGYHVVDAPTRSEFLSRSDGWMFAPVVWNPYYSLPVYSAFGSAAVARECPPEPPQQEFYRFQ